jgi:hypothetical protein
VSFTPVCIGKQPCVRVISLQINLARDIPAKREASEKAPFARLAPFSDANC